jgi:AcrR family transcriptional regulator
MTAESVGTSTQGRVRLSREKVLRSALALVDEFGIGSLTIRSLAQAMGAKPMAIYHYVANKDEILDSLVDQVFSEIDLPSDHGGWRVGMYRRANSVRAVLQRHTWAIGLLESRTSPGPATLDHHEATLGVLRRAGFSVAMTAHAYALLDSYIYGFALQESALPLSGPEPVADTAQPMRELFSGGKYPYLYEIATERVLQPGYNFGDEFEIGLNVILDALEDWISHHSR